MDRLDKDHIIDFVDSQPMDIQLMLFRCTDSGHLMLIRLIHLLCKYMVFPPEIQKLVNRLEEGGEPDMEL